MMVFVLTGIWFFDVFIILGAAVLAVYIYFLHSFQYWKKRGVPYLKPKFLYGNNPTLILKSTTFGGESRDWYEKLKRKGYKFGGVWSFSKKVFVLIDPDYIKDVLTLDFQYFTDREIYSNKNDPISVHLFNVENPEWKPLRQKLTRIFTSGKIKHMFDGIIECSTYMIEYMQKKAKRGEDVDARDVLASFTTDVIGCVAFGVESNSFNEEYNQFREQSRKLFVMDLVIFIKLFLIINFPKLMKRVGISPRNNEVTSFFSNLVKQTIDHRIKNNIHRQDFLQLLIDMNQSNTVAEEFTFEQIVANTILFFIAGFDTSSTTMTYALFLLAQNPELQEKARNEIQNVLKKNQGQLTYESLQHLIYLQQVIDETTRLYPPLLSLARRCVKDYQLRGTNVIIERGTPVVISTYGLGRDPEYFPEPEKFDPDRFSAENKASRHQYIHLPFGEGPRNCIGLRFGLMQTKIGLVQILNNFKLSVSPKTKLPVQIDETRFLLKEMSPIYFNLEKI